MRVLVTGAGGFIGRVLVHQLLETGVGGQRVSQLIAADLDVAGLPDDLRMVVATGSIANPSFLEGLLADAVDVVFHLASVPGGAAERDPALGRRVNLDATLHLVDLLRAQGNRPRLVFASSVAVYGESLPPIVDEDTPALPAMSYGAHKLAAETMIADADRRGWIRACSLRLPGIVARPEDGAGLVSAFMSQVFWRLRAGERVVLPVSACATAWWASVGSCVDNLIHAAEVDTDLLGPRRVVQMPALRLSMSDVVDALATAYGDDRRRLVRYEPQAAVQRLFGAYPPLETPRALGWGFRHDGSIAALVCRATRPSTAEPRTPCI